MLHFHVVTLFPETIEPYLSASILGRAQKRGKIAVHFYNPRDYTDDPHRRVDQVPYGGGPGMVLEPVSVLRAAEAALKRKRNVSVVFFSPAGKQFDNEMARTFAEGADTRTKHILFLCGRYEGIDARVPQILNAQAISIGPYVLSGGELPAAVMIDAIARQIPGVLGDPDSREECRTASFEVYTRPAELQWKGKVYPVPEVLRSGNHAAIEAWKKERATMDNLSTGAAEKRI